MDRTADVERGYVRGGGRVKTAGVHSVRDRVGRSATIRRKAGLETGDGAAFGDSLRVTGRTADFDDWTTTSSSAANDSANGAGATNAISARRAIFTIPLGPAGPGPHDRESAISGSDSFVAETGYCSEVGYSYNIQPGKSWDGKSSIARAAGSV